MSTLDSDLPIPAEEPDDDVELELEALALRRRRKLPRVTLVLTLAVIGAGAFIGGAEAQKHLGTSSGSGGSNASSLASRFRNTSTTSGRTAGGFGTFGGGTTVGSVTAIKGSTLYVTDTSGNTVKVTTSARSQVTKSVTGTMKDIHPGDTIVVRGTAQKNGDVAADSITLGGAAASGGATGFGNNGGATGFGGNSGGGG
ncbi:MAG: hypothetical protein ACRDL2_01800 [Gaiellaceae bacterium]